MRLVILDKVIGESQARKGPFVVNLQETAPRVRKTCGSSSSTPGIAVSMTFILLVPLKGCFYRNSVGAGSFLAGPTNRAVNPSRCGTIAFMRAVCEPRSFRVLWICLRALVCLLSAFGFVPLCPAETARLSGTIFTDTNPVQTVWPNARVTLKSLTSGREVATVSDELGVYSFAAVLPGEYELTVTLAGFDRATARITLSSESANRVDVQLTLQKQAESVSVLANP